MYRSVFSTILMLFLAFLVTSEAADSTTETSVTEIDEIILYNGNNEQIKGFDINSGLVLGCDSSNPKMEFEWYKGNKSVNNEETLKGRFRTIKKEFKFIIDRTKVGDAGMYSCREPASDGKEAVIVKSFQAIAKPAVKLPLSVSVVEGEKLRIACTIVGNPTPNITWIVDGFNETLSSSSGRYVLSTGDDKIPNSVMTVEDIVMEDRGEFTCIATNHVINVFHNATTLVRVKDKLAALWPFLGICAEVFVLCAVILIYEKKRNKTEMEESDTDQSPDQKNAADMGKDSEVRQRK